jgi:Na+/H+-dicarboxylate symporter
MKALHWLSHSVPGLLLCLVAGALAGTVAGPLGRFAWLVGQLYLSVVNMAAVPLLVVATFFGLRQVLALPRAGARFGAIIGTAAGVVGACALAGALAGVVAAPGAGLSAPASEKLGALILSGVADGGEVRVDLHGNAAAEAEVANAAKASDALGEIIPDNFYRALAHGQTLGVLTGTLLFGLAFAALSREQTGMLSNVFDGIYRTFEQIIAHANLLIPVLAFGLAAHLSMHADRAAMGAMAGVLVTFLMLCLLLSGVAAAAIAACGRLSFAQVVTELNGSMLVGLASGSATAPIPHTIEAMSARLGFPRGLVELVVPLGAVFVRGGSALYFALVTVFVANLYGRPVSAGDVAWIAMAATIAAWLSAGQGGMGTVAYAGVALSVLQLPAEAAAVLLLAIDPICDGPRNALSLVCTCVVIALVSVGLPMERVAAQPMPDRPARVGLPGARLPTAPAAAVRLVLTRAQLALASASALLAALLLVLMGIGVGAK